MSGFQDIRNLKDLKNMLIRLRIAGWSGEVSDPYYRALIMVPEEVWGLVMVYMQIREAHTICQTAHVWMYVT